MRKLIICLMLVSGFGVSPILAQSDLTTFILVRHAEKGGDDPRDPNLSLEGKARAERLAVLLKDQPISAVYSTPFKRTRSTAAPVAQLHQLQVMDYDFRSPTYLAEMLKKHQGGTVFIAGHSNTTPMVANLLLGEQRFEQLDEKEYGKLFIVTVSALGKGTVTVINY